MIDFKDIHLRYGAQIVLDGVSFRIHAGERVGIVGPNGAGKSSLFHLLIGSRQPDGGTVSLEGKPTIGYVRQHLDPEDDTETLLEYSLRGVPRLHDMEMELHRLAGRSRRLWTSRRKSAGSANWARRSLSLSIWEATSLRPV